MHAVAVRLRDDGVDLHVIAVALAIDDAQVPLVLDIADAKLANLEAVPGAVCRPASSPDREPTTTQIRSKTGDMT